MKRRPGLRIFSDSYNNLILSKDGELKNILREVGASPRHCGVYFHESSATLIEVFPKGMSEIGIKGGPLERWYEVFRSFALIDQRLNPANLTPSYTTLNATQKKNLPIFELFLLETLTRTVSALRKGIPVQVIKEGSVVNAPAGRVNWSQQIAKQHGFKHRFYVEKNVLKHEKPIYTFIRSALELLYQKNKSMLSSVARRHFNEALSMTSQFAFNPHLTDFEPKVKEFLRSAPPNLRHFREPVASLAKWVYGWTHDVADPLKFSFTGFSINLERLFEVWCRQQLVPRLIAHEATLRSTPGETYLQWGSGTQKIIKPDILIFKGRDQISHILDAKYKVLGSPQSLDDTENLIENETDVSRADFYQMISYRTAVIEGKLTQNKQAFSAKGSEKTRLVLLIPEQSRQYIKSPIVYEFSINRATKQVPWNLRIVQVPFNFFLSHNGKYPSLDNVVAALDITR